MGEYYTIEQSIWNTVLYSLVNQGKSVEDAIVSANKALAAFRAVFIDTAKVPIS